MQQPTRQRPSGRASRTPALLAVLGSVTRSIPAVQALPAFLIRDSAN
jgi:hypothetical protein